MKIAVPSEVLRVAMFVTPSKRIPRFFYRRDAECAKSRRFCHPRVSGDPVLDNLHWIPAFTGMTTSRMCVFT